MKFQNALRSKIFRYTCVSIYSIVNFILIFMWVIIFFLNYFGIKNNFIVLNLFWKADQTELDQTALFSAKEHEATSTPYLSKRVCELRNLAGSVTADLFRSVTEFKSEISVINGNLSRFSNNFSANSTNINEIDNTGLSAIFDKSDLQYANVNTLILRLEQMVEQFTAMQSELEEKLKIYKGK